MTKSSLNELRISNIVIKHKNKKIISTIGDNLKGRNFAWAVVEVSWSSNKKLGFWTWTSECVSCPLNWALSPGDEYLNHCLQVSEGNGMILLSMTVYAWFFKILMWAVSARIKKCFSYYALHKLKVIDHWKLLLAYNIQILSSLFMPCGKCYSIVVTFFLKPLWGLCGYLKVFNFVINGLDIYGAPVYHLSASSVLIFVVSSNWLFCCW